MSNSKSNERMFDRINTFIIPACAVSRISNKEVVGHLVACWGRSSVAYSKGFDAICDRIENLAKVEFVKVTFSKMDETHFKLTLERVTSLKELADSYCIVNDVNAAITAFIEKAIYPNISINFKFNRCSYIWHLSDFTGKVTLPLVPITITIPDKDGLESLQDEYCRKQEEEAMAFTTPRFDFLKDEIVEPTEDAGFMLIADNIEDANIIED